MKNILLNKIKYITFLENGPKFGGFRSVCAELTMTYVGSYHFRPLIRVWPSSFQYMFYWCISVHLLTDLILINKNVLKITQYNPIRVTTILSHYFTSSYKPTEPIEIFLQKYRSTLERNVTKITNFF